MGKVVKAVYVLFLVLTLGFLFPIVFPGRQVTLTGLLGSIFGFSLVLFSSLAAFENGRYLLIPAAIAAANVITICGWFVFSFCLYVLFQIFAPLPSDDSVKD